jgi:hypothetical protein
MTTASATTDHRILIAVLRLITYGQLERRKDAEKLVQEPNQNRINTLTHHYLSLAEKTNYDRNTAEHRAPHMALERLVTITMFAAHDGYPIRRAAQGTRGENPSRHVWCLLNAVLTLLVVDTTGPNERYQLEQQVSIIAAGLSEL